MTQSSVLSPQSSAFPGWPPGFQEALERLAVAARRPAAGHEPGMGRARVRGRALEFADHRPYVAGDDPRLVDWRAYARLDRLYLKQYDEERSRTLTLLVDVSASLDWGIGEAHKGAYARRLAAALAWIGVSGHEPVRVFLLRDGAPLALPPVSTRTEAIDLFRRLAAVQEQGATRLDGALRGVAAGLAGRARGPVVLLSDLLDPGWEDALRAVAALGAGGAPAAAGDGAVVQVLAPD